MAVVGSDGFVGVSHDHHQGGTQLLPDWTGTELNIELNKTILKYNASDYSVCRYNVNDTYILYMYSIYHIRTEESHTI